MVEAQGADFLSVHFVLKRQVFNLWSERGREVLANLTLSAKKFRGSIS